MRRKRTLFLGSIISAVSLVLAPRMGGRRAAGGRARRLGRGALGAFAGTPCAQEQRGGPAGGEAAGATLVGETLAGGDGGRHADAAPGSDQSEATADGRQQAAAPAAADADPRSR